MAGLGSDSGAIVLCARKHDGPRSRDWTTVGGPRYPKDIDLAPPHPFQGRGVRTLAGLGPEGDVTVCAPENVMGRVLGIEPSWVARNAL